MLDGAEPQQVADKTALHFLPPPPLSLARRACSTSTSTAASAPPAMATQRLRHKIERDGLPDNVNVNENFCTVRGCADPGVC